jgi:hypothetical protein
MAAKTKSATRPKGWKRAAYILRTCNDDLTSYGGFQWSEAGLVEAPDWRSDDRCGRGLHGFLNGEGDGGLANFADDAKWIVAEIEAGWVDLSGKVKFPRAFVVHCGDRLSASEFLTAVGLKGAFVGGTATAGYRGTATAGYRREAPRPLATEAPRPPGTEAPRPPGTEAPRPPGTEAPRPPGTEAPRPPGREAPRPLATEAPRPLATEARFSSAIGTRVRVVTGSSPATLAKTGLNRTRLTASAPESWWRHERRSPPPSAPRQPSG